MALIFICSNCGNKYTARIDIRTVKYENNGAMYVLESGDSNCFACIEDAKEAGRKAEQEALERRKKKI